MSTEEIAKKNQACCSEGTVKPNVYTGRGDIITLPDGMKVYRVGKEHKKGAICVYDIFGFDIGNTRHFCDLMSEAGLQVMMPDFFLEKPWETTNFPPADMNDIFTWVQTAGNWEVVEKALTGTADLLRKGGVEGKLGIFGFCWGGLQVLRACGEIPNAFAAGVSIHGSFLQPEYAEKVNCPLALLPACEFSVVSCSGSSSWVATKALCCSLYVHCTACVFADVALSSVFSKRPSIDDLKAILDRKPFAAENRFHYFHTQEHGFAAARGDWSDPETKTCVDKAVAITKEMFGKHVM